MMEKTQEIKLSEIDWNKLSHEEFQAVSKRVNEMTSKRHSVNKRITGGKNLVLATIEGVQYMISERTFNRLNLMTSDKARQNLIDEIKSTHTPYNDMDIMRL